MNKSVWIIGLVALWATGTANGDTWHVADINCNQGPGSGTEGDPFCTIQLGIDAAVDGDEVVLGEGSYLETINLLGKAITVRSTDPVDPAVVAATIIDGFHLQTSVITCNSGEDENTVITGLTIKRGNPLNGGGMINIGSSPTVMNCTFSDNHATGGGAKGGGMHNISGSNPTLINCAFINNEADYLGGGMYNANSNPTVINCSFSGNDGSTGGGGMYNIGCNLIVTDCTFNENDATGGGGMHNEGGTAMVTNSTFSGNTATSGGGIDNHDSDVTVTDCSFIGNSATGGGGMQNHESNVTVTGCTFRGNSATGGGGMNNNSGDVTVTNSTFTGNTATSGGGISTNDSNTTISNCSFSVNYAFSLGGAAYFSVCNGCPQPVVNNSVFWGDDAMYNGEGAGSYEIWLGGWADPVMNYSNIQGGGFAGIANIDADPLFIDADGPDDIPGTEDDNLRLSAGSPVIDAGDCTAVPVGVMTDRDGNARFVDDPDTPDTGNPDGTPCPADFDGDGYVNAADLAQLLGNWGSYEPCPPFGPADFNEDCAVSAADLAQLLGSWGPCSPIVDMGAYEFHGSP